MVPLLGASGGGMSSSFLSGAGSAIGSALGGSLFKGGDGYNTYRSHQRKMQNQATRHNINYTGETQMAEMRGRMAALKDAGLHPLAALGMQMSGGPTASTSPMSIPGQSNTGSAIAEGIQQYSRAKATQSENAHFKQMGAMKLQEQQLRNDYLGEQIKNSQLRRATQLANVQQDQVTLASLRNSRDGKTQKPIMVTPQKGYEHATDTSGYNIFGLPIRQRPGKLTMKGAEDALGDVGSALYSPFSILQDIGYTLDQEMHKRGTKWYDAPASDMGSP